MEQADAGQQGEGQLDLHYELCQAGGGLIQATQLFGGKEAHVPVQPASRCPRWLMVELYGVCSKLEVVTS